MTEMLFVVVASCAAIFVSGFAAGFVLRGLR